MTDEDESSVAGGGGDGVPRTASEASVFSNLEAIRTSLEDQLGLDTMLHAYHMVQVCIGTYLFTAEVRTPLVVSNFSLVPFLIP